MKTCVKCKQGKTPESFAGGSSGRCCRECKAAYNREYHLRHKEELNAKCRERNAKNRDKLSAYGKEYYAKNKQYFSEHNRRWREANREEHNRRKVAYQQARRNSSPIERLICCLRSQVRLGVLRAGGVKTRRTHEYLGCSFPELRAHFERLFLPGMSWENYSEWHIGHRRPVASFDLTDPSQVFECFHFSNLFPQWREENLRQLAKYSGVNFQGLRAEQYEVKEIPYSEARFLVEKFHYSGTCPRAASEIFGLFRKGSDVCLGAAVFCPTIPAICRTFYDGPPSETLCLSRVVIVPELGKNAASYFLSQCCRKLKQKGSWRCLFTYSDEWRGHSGTIYRAANWEYLGMTAPQPVWTRDGKVVCRRRGLCHTKSARELLAEGAEFQGEFVKHRFRYLLR